MLLQVLQVKQFWKMSHLDAIVWLVTFLTVVIFSIDIGLLVGIMLSLACIFIRGMKPYTCNYLFGFIFIFISKFNFNNIYLLRSSWTHTKNWSLFGRYALQSCKFCSWILHKNNLFAKIISPNELRLKMQHEIILKQNLFLLYF